MVAATRSPFGDIQVVVSPITHAPRRSGRLDRDSRAVCRRLGFDAGRHWLRLEELNRFAWPGFDLRPIPGRDGEVAYGKLPSALFEALRQGILARQAARRVRVQLR